MFQVIFISFLPFQNRFQFQWHSLGIPTSRSNSNLVKQINLFLHKKCSTLKIRMLCLSLRWGSACTLMCLMDWKRSWEGRHVLIRNTTSSTVLCTEAFLLHSILRSAFKGKIWRRTQEPTCTKGAKSLQSKVIWLIGQGNASCKQHPHTQISRLHCPSQTRDWASKSLSKDQRAALLPRREQGFLIQKLKMPCFWTKTISWDKKCQL